MPRASASQFNRAPHLPIDVPDGGFTITLKNERKPASDALLRAISRRQAAEVRLRPVPRPRLGDSGWQRRTGTDLRRAPRPGRITDFICSEKLLPVPEIERIVRDAPTELVRFQDVAAAIPVQERPTMASWLDLFNTHLKDAA